MSNMTNPAPETVTLKIPPEMLDWLTSDGLGELIFTATGRRLDDVESRILYLLHYAAPLPPDCNTYHQDGVPF